MINELGPNDWRFKAIKQAYEGGNAKKVGAVVCQNPNAHWNQVEEALLDADYGDMVQFADELNLEQNNEEKMLNEIKRMQKLAGLLKENDEMGASAAIFDIDESQMERFAFDVAELINAVGLGEYQEGIDYELGIARGDDFPHAIEIKNPQILQDQNIVEALKSLEEEAPE